MDNIFSIWPWYVTGPLIGLFVPLILIAGNKLFGISSSLLHICSIVLGKGKLRGYNSDNHRWKLYFVIGISIGAFISVNFLTTGKVKFLPEFYYSLNGFILLFTGGVLIGFGTRYANGCTSGHSISGISTFQLSGFIATLAFFTGGLLYTYILYPMFN